MFRCCLEGVSSAHTLMQVNFVDWRHTHNFLPNLLNEVLIVRMCISNLGGVACCLLCVVCRAFLHYIGGYVMLCVVCFVFSVCLSVCVLSLRCILCVLCCVLCCVSGYGLCCVYILLLRVVICWCRGVVCCVCPNQD